MIVPFGDGSSRPSAFRVGLCTFLIEPGHYFPFKMAHATRANFHSPRKKATFFQPPNLDHAEGSQFTNFFSSKNSSNLVHSHLIFSDVGQINGRETAVNGNLI